MSSTILYKFRSGTTFEALPLPGSAARLLDVKKAIVAAKKLDQGSMDFDLSVKDAASGAEYMDDTVILPRGTRLIVQRLPAARGQGILAKIARSQYGGGGAPPHTPNIPYGTGNSDFFTIDSRGRDEDEEFVSSSSTAHAAQPSNEENELAALRAATQSTATSLSGGVGGGAMLRGGMRGAGPAGSGPPPPRGNNFQQYQQPRHNNVATNINTRPNADPELRDQEQQPKKRATGIPRTFLNLSAPPTTDGSDGAVGSSMPLLQPNTIGFEELVNRGGGQSENATGTKRDLDYAIKLTSTTIPEYLQCAICHGVVRDAMMLPWDSEGRTTCEQCIRNALAENGFRCPLTQQEGVSPDDLLPNHALRKAAVQFVKEVMEKIKEIDKQAEVEEEIVTETEGGTSKSKLLEGDMTDKGVVLSRRASAAEKRKKEEEDPFGGGEDDFGGDVFAVEADKLNAEDAVAAAEPVSSLSPKSEVKLEPIVTESKESALQVNATVPSVKVEAQPNHLDHSTKATPSQTGLDVVKSEPEIDVRAGKTTFEHHNSATRREGPSRRRGPPVGYTMGPASSGPVVKPLLDNAAVERHRPYSPRGSAAGGGDSSTNSRHPPEDDHERSHGRGGGRGGRGSVRGGGGRNYSERFDSNDSPRVGRGSSAYHDSYPPRHDVSTLFDRVLHLKTCFFRVRMSGFSSALCLR